MFRRKSRGSEIKDSSGELSAFITTGFQRALCTHFVQGSIENPPTGNTFSIKSHFIIPGVGSSLFFINIMADTT